MIQPPRVGPTHRCDERRKAEQRHRRALLLLREGVKQHALAAGLQTAAGQALEHAEYDQLAQAAGHAAQRRAEGEYGDRQQEVVATAEVRGQPAGDRQNDGIGGEVARETHSPSSTVAERPPAM